MNAENLKLYLVTDQYNYSDNQFLEIINEICANGATMIQLREKKGSTRDFYEMAVKVKQLVQIYNIPLIINDRLDICMAVNADGLHVGEADLPVAVARKILGPNKLIGASVKTAESAKLAIEAGADYLGIGAVFPTKTKKDADYVSIETLTTIKQQTKFPIVAIGGIHAENISQLSNSNIDGIAVVSELMLAKKPGEKTIELLKQVENMQKA